ncbi:MAG: hypothetical protein LC753_00435 [Acidobacteria bacterium]|nr:hypothetical protein [Acidobacteriota bacterium]MCA1648781.1 hypothetical protein [Acidobacteriota bacterium]
MSRLRLGAIAFAVLGLFAALAYLRDPPWLLSMTSGLREERHDPADRTFRTMAGHASFFVPTDAASVEIPLRGVFESEKDWPITVTIAIDDRLADRLTLTDASWRVSTLRLPPPSRRRVRRIDIRADRTRADQRAVEVGEWKSIRP